MGSNRLKRLGGRQSHKTTTPSHQVNLSKGRGQAGVGQSKVHLLSRFVAWGAA